MNNYFILNENQKQTRQRTADSTDVRQSELTKYLFDFRRVLDFHEYKLTSFARDSKKAISFDLDRFPVLILTQYKTSKSEDSLVP